MVRINKKALLVKSYCWGLVFLWSFILGADTKTTAEGGAVRIVSYAVRDYQLSHGQSPTNWEQLTEFRDIETINKGTYPVKEHYVFVASYKIPLPDLEKGDVLLIRTSPATNNSSGEMGRYVVSRNGSDFILTWLPEEKIQKMLADAGITELPKPDVPSTPKEHSPVKIPPSVNSTPGPTVPSDRKKSQVTGHDLPDPSASKTEPSTGSNAVRPPVATATPGSGTSWFGMIAVLSLGLFASIFLLFRARQK